MNFEFLDVDDVLVLHSLQLERFGGSEGVRDMGLLESAVAQPRATFGGDYLHRDVFEMAAAYLFHIVGNHAFVDGNKRTGLAAALAFLELHGLGTDEDESTNKALLDATLAVAEGRMGKRELAEILGDVTLG